MKADYLYNLSSFTGTIPYNWVRLYCDRKNKEVYVINPSDKSVRVFNENGMEVFSFGDDEAAGDVMDLAVAESGDLLLLSMIKGKYAVLKTDFRGDLISGIELKGFQKDRYPNFSPVNILYKDGRIYLVDKSSMLVVVADNGGSVLKYYDIGALLNFDEKKKADTGIVGFSLGRDGDMLFTIPSLFSAFVVAPDGSVRSFGVRGSSPGKFNIVAGITSDDKGNYYVVDTLRCVVMVFDKEFRFMSEFGYMGLGPGNLVAPMDLEVDDAGKLYVTQGRGRGVSVFRVGFD